MTRLQQARIQQAKHRLMQTQLEAALDGVIPRLPVQPAKAFEALLVYALDGLVLQGTVQNKEQALRFVSHALTKRGLIG